MNILQTIVAKKKEEILNMEDVPAHILQKSNRDFLKAITAVSSEKRSAPRLIAEIKPASPVTGRILPERIPIGSLAAGFESFGASALSVLTDTEFFRGSYENMRLAKASTAHVPILCKDFILSAKQVRKARAFGADSFLLIAKILSVSSLRMLLEEGRKYGMEAMVEIADKEDAKKVLQTDAKIIGINNRDLRDFSLHLSHTFLLSKLFPKNTVIVSLSGFSGADIRLVRGVAHAVLVGTNIGKQLQDYTVSWKEKLKTVFARFTSPAPLIKLCGVRSVADYEMAERYHVPLIGINCVSASHRCISEQVVQSLAAKKKKKAKIVGVFQNHSPEIIAHVCAHYGFDFAQLSGNENPADFSDFPVPIIKGISFDNRHQFLEEREKWQKNADIFLFDGKTPGAGEGWNTDEVQDIFSSLTKPFFIAGGVAPENALSILKKTGADGVDMASGVENAEKNGWDEKKIRELRKLCKT